VAPIGRLRRAQPAIAPATRIYAIGDIHGRADLLADTLRRIDEDRTRFPISTAIEVFLGDYVDRGRYSSAVIDLLCDRVETHSAICLRGNHEFILQMFLDDPFVLRDWATVGGLNTIASYGVGAPDGPTATIEQDIWNGFQAAFPERHREFLANLTSSFLCGDFLFVHAGIKPGVPLDRQDPADLMWIREEFLQSRKDFGVVVVHGHTPVDTPEVHANRINIDTKAYLTGNLTCLVIEGTDISFL